MEYVEYREPELKILEDEEKSERHAELMAKLGLQKPKEDSLKIMPFMHMNTVVENALAILCPSQDKIESYNKSTIPLEALEAIEYCTENKLFDWIEVWHAKKDPDPILVGIVKVGEYSWNKERYLIARWGDEALTIEELVEKAYHKATEAFKTKLIMAETMLAAYKKDPMGFVKQHIQGIRSIERLDVTPD